MDYELLIYEKIGMTYVVMGEVEKSKYYHNRLLSGEIENHGSASRTYSNK